jgi:predicted dehydrogenase
VGFNRRFSPLARELRSAFEGFAGPLVMNYTVNAGPLPAGHWSADPGEGGRLLGEVGHFIDLTSWLAGEPVTSVSAVSCGEGEAQALFSFAETGSTASLTYTGLGDAGHLKERLEVFGGGRVAVLTDFRRLETVREGRRKRRTRRQDKGHRAEMAALAEALELGAPDAPFPFEELRQTTLASLAVAESVTEGRAIPVGGA